MAVFGVEDLEFLSVVGEIDASVGQDAVDIEEETP